MTRSLLKNYSIKLHRNSIFFNYNKLVVVIIIEHNNDNYQM